MTEEEQKDNSLKISIPILTNKDLDYISNYHNELIDKFTQSLVHDKDLLIAQELIKIQKEELEKKDKIINELIDTIVKLRENSTEDCFIPRGYRDIDECIKCTCDDCIKQYIEDKVNSSEQN